MCRVRRRATRRRRYRRDRRGRVVRPEDVAGVGHWVRWSRVSASVDAIGMVVSGEAVFAGCTPVIIAGVCGADGDGAAVGEAECAGDTPGVGGVDLVEEGAGEVAGPVGLVGEAVVRHRGAAIIPRRRAG